MAKKSLRVRIFAIVALSITVLCGGLVYNASRNHKESELRFAAEKLKGSASEASEFIQNRMNSAMNTIRYQFGWVLDSAQPNTLIKTNEKSVSLILKSILEQNPQMLGIWIEWEKDTFAKSPWQYERLQGPPNHRRTMSYWTRNAKGELSEGLGDDANGEADQSYYMIPFESKKEGALDPYIYPIDGVNILMTSLVIPIIKDSKVLGVAGVDIDLAATQKLADEIKLFEGQGELAIVTSTGMVMGWTKKSDQVNKKFDGLEPKDFSDLVQKLKNETQKNGLAEYKDSFVMVKEIQIGKSDQPWYAMSFVPQKVVLQPLFKAMTYQIFASVFFALVMLSLMMMFVHNFSKRLMNTTENLVHLSETNNSVSEKVKQASAVVTSGNTSNSSAVHETVASLDEISSMIQANSEMAQKSDQSVKETVFQAKTGSSDMEEVVQSMGEILNVSEEMVTEFEKNANELKTIVDMIKEIDTKTKVINEIVFQTKLLSFNASVEAARAGEYGKGFSVVAEEIGSLALMSGRSAKEITDILSGSSGRISEIIEKSIGSIRTLTEKTQVRARTGDELAKKCQGSLGAVLQTAEELQNLITQIANASKEQADGVANITTAMHMINSTSATNRTASEEALVCAEDLLKNSGTLYGLAQEIKTEILGHADENGPARSPHASSSENHEAQATAA